jgi:hypothetical protein
MAPTDRPGEAARTFGEGDSTMTLVLLTAVATWVLMLVMDVVNVGGFLLESTIAVIGGAIIGFFGAWILRRRNRRNR